jgi:hypothetical protein
MSSGNRFPRQCGLRGPSWPTLRVLILEAAFDHSVPTWKVDRNNGKDALPNPISSGGADSFEAAKAAALHVAESTEHGRPGNPSAMTCPGERTQGRFPVPSKQGSRRFRSLTVARETTVSKVAA